MCIRAQSIEERGTLSNEEFIRYLDEHGQEVDKLCYEHHKLLKKEIDDLKGLLFGDVKHAEQPSLMVKVNLLYDALKYIIALSLTSIGVIFGAVYYIGGQLNQLEHTSKAIEAHLEDAKQIEIRIAALEAREYKR